MKHKKKTHKAISLILFTTLFLSACSSGNGSTPSAGTGTVTPGIQNNSGTTITTPGGSGNSDAAINNILGNNTETDAETDIPFVSQTDDDMFSKRDNRTEYDANSTTIRFNGTSVSCNSPAVKINGTTVTLLDEGTYILTGTLNDGMVIIQAEENDKLQLVFDNVSITSSTSAPLYILEADKVFVTLADGSSNTISTGDTFTAIDENNIDGAIFSKQDLTFNGTGSLTINSVAGHGIVCKDDLVFTGGTYVITSSGHGLDVNDSVRISDGSFTLASGKDGIHAEHDDITSGFVYISGGTFTITAEGDGISTGAYLQITDGNFTILCGGGYENGTSASSQGFGSMGGGRGDWGFGGTRPGTRPGQNSSGEPSGNTANNSGNAPATDTQTDDSTSMKALKADGTISIEGGTFTLNSADDGVHSNQDITVSGGSLTIASGDDGVHAEDNLTVTGGDINVTQSYEGLEALHIQIDAGNIKLNANDDGINAAGGTDASGTTGGRDGMFGGGFGGGFGGMSANSNGTIKINGGTIFMYAKGDGIDANGSVEITGGNITVTGPTNGDTSILDFDTTGTITGGTFIGVGAINMAQSFSNGTQGVIALSASGSANTNLRLTDANGNELINYTPAQAFTCVILSSPDMVSGESYTIYIGNQSGTFTAN